MGGEVRKRVATTDRLGVVYLLQPQRLGDERFRRRTAPRGGRTASPMALPNGGPLAKKGSFTQWRSGWVKFFTQQTVYPLGVHGRIFRLVAKFWTHNLKMRSPTGFSH